MSDRVFDAEGGLVCAYMLDRKGGGRELMWDGIETVAGDDGLLWVHLDFSKPKARHWIRDESGLDPNIADALLAEDIRPRSVEYPKGILALLRGVNTNPGSKAEDMVSIRVWLEKDRIISTRRRRLLSMQDLRKGIMEGTGPSTSGNFVAEMSARLVHRIVEVVDEIDDEQDTAEARIQGRGNVSQRGEFADIRRRTARIRRYLSPQRDALDRLSRMQGEILDAKDCLAMQEATNEVMHSLEELDLARERAMVAREEVLNILAHEQNTKMYLLSMVAAVFLPLSFLTGLFGMNVAGLPGLENPSAFMIVSAIMVACGLAILLVFKIKRWF